MYTTPSSVTILPVIYEEEDDNEIVLAPNYDMIVDQPIVSQKVPPNSPANNRTFHRTSSPAFFPINAFGEQSNNASLNEEDDDDLLLLHSSQESAISILEEANVSFCRFELTGSFGDDATRLFSDECDLNVSVSMPFEDTESITDSASFDGGELIEDIRHAERREQRRLSAAKSNAAKKLSDDSALIKFKSILSKYQSMDNVLAERLANTDSSLTKLRAGFAVLKRRKGAIKKQRRIAQLQMNSAASHIRRISERKAASVSLQDLAIDCTL